jgi:hypothetical protein
VLWVYNIDNVEKNDLGRDLLQLWKKHSCYGSNNDRGKIYRGDYVDYVNVYASKSSPEERRIQRPKDLKKIKDENRPKDR